MAHDRLLEVAVHEFGQKGLEGASTRGIAAGAGTAMSAITYHFGSKEGLYLAAADYIAAQMSDLVKESGAPLVEGVPGDPTAARAALHAMLAALLTKMSTKRSEAWSLFIVREQIRPTEAFDRIFGGPMGRMMHRMADLVAVATGVTDMTVARVTMLTLFGQVLVTRAAQAACSRVLERDLADPELIAQFVRRIAANTDAILDRLIAERQEPL
jgi:AcrR family transcriptional regulator